MSLTLPVPVFGGGVGVCFLMFCRSLVVSLNSLDQPASHICPHQLCASFFCFSPFFASFLFHFLLFPSISIDDMGATSGGFFFWIFLFLFLACFQMGFYFVTTGWIFEIGLCVNSINQNQSARQENIFSGNDTHSY